jgi:hypothetical protein
MAINMFSQQASPEKSLERLIRFDTELTLPVGYATEKRAVSRFMVHARYFILLKRKLLSASGIPFVPERPSALSAQPEPESITARPQRHTHPDWLDPLFAEVNY